MLIQRSPGHLICGPLLHMTVLQRCTALPPVECLSRKCNVHYLRKDDLCYFEHLCASGALDALRLLLTVPSETHTSAPCRSVLCQLSDCSQCPPEQDAILAKFFVEDRGAAAKAQRKMGAILRTCAEVADGMAYLHARGIVHGDLTGSNVLLQSSEVRASLDNLLWGLVCWLTSSFRLMDPTMLLEKSCSCEPCLILFAAGSL